MTISGFIAEYHDNQQQWCQLDPCAAFDVEAGDAHAAVEVAEAHDARTMQELERHEKLAIYIHQMAVDRHGDIRGRVGGCDRPVEPDVRMHGHREAG